MDTQYFSIRSRGYKVLLKAGCEKVLSQHCDSFRLYQKYVEPNVEYMHNYYLKEVKGNAEICKRKNYSGERKAS